MRESATTTVRSREEFRSFPYINARSAARRTFASRHSAGDWTHASPPCQAYIRSGNVIAISRTNSSDGNNCHYMGTINGRAVAGTVQGSKVAIRVSTSKSFSAVTSEMDANRSKSPK